MLNMKIYDYRNDLIELLKNTDSSQESLRQTLQNLTTIVKILNHYDVPVENDYPTEPSSPIKPNTVTRPKRPTKISANNEKASQIQTQKQPILVETVSQEEQLAADNYYLVHRKLSGAEINHRYYNENLLHSLPFQLNDGDIVELDPNQTVRGLPVIRRVTANHLDNYAPEDIEVIEYAELTKVPGSDVLQISSTIQKNSILDKGTANTIVIDPFKYPSRNLRAGMVIDFAYFNRGNGLNDAKQGSIRWIHEKGAFDTVKQPKKPKKVKKVTHTRHNYEAKLDYDLKQRIVLVISGDREHSNDLKGVIDKHHGIFHFLDASMEDKVSSSKMKREIREADFIVVGIDKIHHRISQLANHHAKRYEKPLAIANTTTNVAVERAIARALNGDPAYAISSELMDKYQKK